MLKRFDLHVERRKANDFNSDWSNQSLAGLSEYERRLDRLVVFTATELHERAVKREQNMLLVLIDQIFMVRVFEQSPDKIDHKHLSLHSLWTRSGHHIQPLRIAISPYA